MTETTQKTGRWKNWLLIGSLALNLAIVGVVAGFALRGGGKGVGGPDGGRAPQGNMFRELVQAVPKAHRDDLRKDLRAKQEDMRGFRKVMRDQRQEFVRVLETPDFDISQIVTILDDHRVVVSKITTGGHQIIVKSIENMSAEERQTFAQNLRAASERRGKRPRK